MLWDSALPLEGACPVNDLRLKDETAAKQARPFPQTSEVLRMKKPAQKQVML